VQAETPREELRSAGPLGADGACALPPTALDGNPQRPSAPREGLLGLLPGLVRAYERFCIRIASRDVHDLGFFLSTYFCGPVGLYLWEGRRGGLARAMGKTADAVKAQPGPRRGSLRLRAGLLVAFSFVPLPVLTFGMPGALGLRAFPGPTGANAAVWLAVWRSEPDRDFERMAEFMRGIMPAGRISDEPPPREEPARPGASDGDRAAYARYLAGREYAELRRRIVHVGREPYGSLYLADRITVATGHRTDSGGWGPEVRRAIMLEEVERARREDPECLFVFRKKHGEFSAEETERLGSEHNLAWKRLFGGRYMVGARGLARVDEAF